MTAVISHFCFKTQRERVTAIYISVFSRHIRPTRILQIFWFSWTSSSGYEFVSYKWAPDQCQGILNISTATAAKIRIYFSSAGLPKELYLMTQTLYYLFMVFCLHGAVGNDKNWYLGVKEEENRKMTDQSKCFCLPDYKRNRNQRKVLGHLQQHLSRVIDWMFITW